MFNVVLAVIKTIAYAYQAILIFSIALSWFSRADNYSMFRAIEKAGNWYLRYFRGRLDGAGPDVGVFLAVVIYGLVIEFSFTV